jgi:hypothetical protein
VWSIQLRRAIALWNAGKHEDAVDEASAAQEADDEYVRSGAILFVSAARLASGLRGDALVRLHALAGHDVRFNEPIAHLDAALAKGGDLAGAIAGVRAALSAEDRAQDFVTAPLFEIVTAAARGTKPLRTESASR